MVVNSAIGHQHESKKCTSASCCSIHKIWKAIQTIIATGDKQAWKQLSQDPDRIAHVKHALLASRAHNDASLYPASHKHKVLQFDKHLRVDATRYFGKAVTDLNALQVALFHRNEAMACSLVVFLRQHAEPAELQSFLNHVWGERNSSLHLACFHGMPRLVRLLLDLGINPAVPNARQLLPADCCKHPGCLAALKSASPAAPRRQSLTPDVPARRQVQVRLPAQQPSAANAPPASARQIKSAPPSPTAPVRRPAWASAASKSPDQRRSMPQVASKQPAGAAAAQIKKPVAPVKHADPPQPQPSLKQAVSPAAIPTIEGTRSSQAPPAKPANAAMPPHVHVVPPEPNRTQRPPPVTLQDPPTQDALPPRPLPNAAATPLLWEGNSSHSPPSRAPEAAAPSLPRKDNTNHPPRHQNVAPDPWSSRSPPIHKVSVSGACHDPLAAWLIAAASLYLQQARFGKRLNPTCHGDQAAVIRASHATPHLVGPGQQQVLWEQHSIAAF